MNIVSLINQMLSILYPAFSTLYLLLISNHHIFIEASYSINEIILIASISNLILIRFMI